MQLAQRRLSIHSRRQKALENWRNLGSNKNHTLANYGSSNITDENLETAADLLSLRWPATDWNGLHADLPLSQWRFPRRDALQRYLLRADLRTNVGNPRRQVILSVTPAASQATAKYHVDQDCKVCRCIRLLVPASVLVVEKSAICCRCRRIC